MREGRVGRGRLKDPRLWYKILRFGRRRVMPERDEDDDGGKDGGKTKPETQA